MQTSHHKVDATATAEIATDAPIEIAPAAVVFGQTHFVDAVDDEELDDDEVPEAVVLAPADALVHAAKASLAALTLAS